MIDSFKTPRYKALTEKKEKLFSYVQWLSYVRDDRTAVFNAKATTQELSLTRDELDTLLFALFKLNRFQAISLTADSQLSATLHLKAYESEVFV